jgi:diaminobutyrate acetyltransferase
MNVTSAILTPTVPTIQAKGPSQMADPVAFREPTLTDGGELWRIACDSQTLDVNSSYSYLLWCRDYATTSIIAEVGGDPGGFVTGYTRPEEPETLMVWQVAVDDAHRGRGIARTMLEELVDRVEDVEWMETTITDDNTASIGLFTKFAEGRDAEITRSDLFTSSHFPDDHDAERLYRIGPLR